VRAAVHPSPGDSGRRAGGDPPSSQADLGRREAPPDPADSRAILVSRTLKGEVLLRDALEIVADIEAGYAAHLGTERMTELKALLADLLGYADPGGTLGNGN
jgi:hypothetical protein